MTAWLAVFGIASIAAARQQPLPPADAPQESRPPEASAEDVSVRYRFLEKYAIVADPERPELVTQYRVGIRANRKTVIDKPQGAPDRFESTIQMIYTEAPATVNKLGDVLDAVRRIDNFALKNQSGPTLAPKVPLFKGLSLLYHLRPGQDAEILSLTDGRTLREIEFAEIHTQIFLPQLKAVFPPKPVRVGDTWPIPLAAAHTLVGENPEADDYQLDGSLVEVTKVAGSTRLNAVIEITGQFFGNDGLNLIRTFIHFAFEPKDAAGPAARAAGSRPFDGNSKPVERVVDARGAVSKVLMARTISAPIPDTDDRLKETVTYQLHLERRPLTAPPSEAGAGQPPATPIVIPEPLPTADDNNSWIAYEDPAGRFRFRHPQELKLDPGNSNPNIISLVNRDLRRSYTLSIVLLSKEAGTEAERKNRDPEVHRRNLFSMWEKQKRDVVAGPSGWLPDADWAPLKRKVYRIEAAIKQGGDDPNTPRIYWDHFLILFNTNQTVVVTAMTDQDHLKFRHQAETLIKSLEFGSADAQAKAAPAANAVPVQPQP